MPKKEITRKGLQHVSKPIKKVMDKVVKKKADKKDKSVEKKEQALKRLKNVDKLEELLENQKANHNLELQAQAVQQEKCLE